MQVPELQQSYELIRPIGEGQKGDLWLARHRRLQNWIAIKILRSQTATSIDIKRFEREARVTASLSSPHTVQVFDFGVLDSGEFYLCLELLSGIDLQTLVKEAGPMHPARTVRMLIHACHALHEAHEVGLVHRDLKPANLMLCRFGLDDDFLKVVDFGMVKDSENSSGERLTLDHTVMGTAAYLSPESLQGSAQVDARSDLYALGCIAFWLLSARLVFQEKQVTDMVRAHVLRPPPSLRSLDPSIPKELEAIVLRCLEKDRSQRPQSAAEVAECLEGIENLTPWTTEDARRWWGGHPELDARRVGPRELRP